MSFSQVDAIEFHDVNNNKWNIGINVLYRYYRYNIGLRNYYEYIYQCHLPNI